MEASSTLFIADLPFDLPESDFISLVSPCDGFVSARLRTDKNNNRVGFVEFVDETTAAAAKHQLQGHKLTADDPDGLSVQFRYFHWPAIRGVS